MTTQKKDTPPIQKEPSPSNMQYLLEQAESSEALKTIFKEIKYKIASNYTNIGLSIEFANLCSMKLKNKIMTLLPQLYDQQEIIYHYSIADVLHTLLISGGFYVFIQGLYYLTRSINKEQRKKTNLSKAFYKQIHNEKNRSDELKSVQLTRRSS